MQIAILKGQVCGGNGRPKDTISIKTNGQGEEYEDHFRRFDLRVIDEQSNKDSEGNRKNYFWHCKLPNGRRGESMFNSLSPGRVLVLVGTYDENPRVGNGADGKVNAYSNATLKVQQLVFCDSEIEFQLNRFLNLAIAAEAMKEDDKEEFATKVKAHIAAANEKNPPRLVDDRRKNTTAPNPKDPKDPVFAK